MRLAGRTVVVTGGTGSFGRKFVEHLLATEPDIRRIVVFSRDEQKQYDMANALPERNHPVAYRIGDVRDRERITEVARGANVIVHAAAMKHVPAAEHNPAECIKTNVLGSQNVAHAAQANGVEKVVVLSTDKAALPSNVYGASKLCMEKLFVAADAAGDTRFTVVRYANVFGTKGSVVPFFLKLKAEGADHLPITDPRMTRFSFSLRDGIDLVLFALSEGWGGDVIVPMAPSYRIMDVARAVAPDLKHRVVGARPGEKIDELLYSEVEAATTVRRGGHYAICPQIGRWTATDYAARTGAELVEPDSRYSSAENTEWLDVATIRQMACALAEPAGA